MKELSKELINLINNFYSKYDGINESIASIKLGPDKWTLKEIIGHLIDSASNNHQRFVRLQIEKELIFPAYEAELWLAIEKINQMNYDIIFSLWFNYNHLIANLIENVDAEKLNNYWKKGNDNISLKDMMIDYLRHLKDHFKHFEERLKEIESL